MRKILRYTLRTLFLLFSAFCLCFLAADLYFEFNGFPVFIQNTIRKQINEQAPFSCKISWIRGGIFSGLKFEQVQLYQKTEKSYLSCTLPQINCSLDLFSLLSSRLHINSLQISNVSAYYQHSPDTPTMFFENGYLNLQQSRNQTLNITMNFKTKGIRMQGRCNLENFSPANLTEALARIQAQLSLFSPAAGSSSDDLVNLAINRLNSYQFGDDDANLQFTLFGNLLRPDDLQAQGYFSVNTAILDNITINKCRGHFSLQNYIVNLSDFHLIFGHGEILKGNAYINLKKQTITASCKGDLTPSIALQTAGLQSSSLLNNFTFHNPIHVDANITETPWDFRQAQVDLNVNFRNIDIRATNIHHGHLKINYSAGTLTVSDLMIAGDFYEQNKITGNILYSLNQGLLSGKLNGDLALLQILASNNTNFNKLSPRQLQKKHQISLDLMPSPLDLSKLNLKGQFRQTDIKIRGRYFAGYCIPFLLQKGILRIDQGTLTLPDGKNTAVLSGSINLAELLNRQQESLNMHLDLFAFSSKLQWEPALSLDADFLLNLKNSTLALTRGEGSTYLSRLYNTYVPILNLPQDEILALVTCEKTPARFTCTIPEFSLNSPENIVVQGKAEAWDGKFNRLTVHHATSDFHLTLNKFSFNNIRATVDNQEKLELDLSAQFTPFCIEIKNGKVFGEPNLISNFIFDEEAEALYRNIWKDVRWDTATPPCFQLKHLLYSESDDDLSWGLELQGSAHIPNARYYDYKFPAVDAQLHMNLPESLEIKPIAVTTEDGRINGYCRLLFANETQCQFAISEKAGTVDILKLLNAIYPDWKKACPDLRLPRKSKISCQGAFNLNPVTPAVQLSGTFAVPELSYQNIQARNLSGIWNFQNQKLFWDIQEAELKKGSLRCSGIFDWNTHAGESQFNLTRIPITEIMSLVPRDSASKKAPDSLQPPRAHRGYVNSSGKIRFYNNWVGRDLLLEGSTHVSVREADLWKVPIMSSLGKLIAMGSFHFFSRNDIATLGTISELDADVEFHGERLFIPKLYTNGTIIALNGSGEYSFLTDKLNFNINGEALKSVNVLAFFLKPLSWVFQAELTGTAQDPKWKMRTALRKIFSTE